jgi:hypothetical protein
MSYEAIYRTACGARADALDFIINWSRYCHEIDDLIDGREKCPEKFLDALALANLIYSSDFYQANLRELAITALAVTNAYADSLAWAADGMEWKRKWADTLRFAGNEMVLAVACICGGYERMRAVSLQLREDSWAAHHHAEQPI